MPTYVLCSAIQKTSQAYCEASYKWCHQESNWGHKDLTRPVLFLVCGATRNRTRDTRLNFYAQSFALSIIKPRREQKRPADNCEAFLRWCHQESNRGHKDFQSFALPTELWHLFSFASAKVGLIFDMAKYSVDNFEIRRAGEGMLPRGDWLCQPCGGGCVPLP